MGCGCLVELSGLGNYNKYLQCRFSKNKMYCIRPNYRTVHLGFSKLLGTLICGKICIYLLRIHYKKDQKKDLFDDDYVIVSDFLYKGICCGHSFELHRQMSSHNICTHLNYIDKSMQFK